LRNHTHLPGVEVGESLDPVANEWADLAERAQAPPFLYPGWFRAWWASFGPGRPRIVTVRRDGRLVAVAPMQLRRGAWCSPTNPHSPAFDLLAIDEDARQALACAVFATGAREIAVTPLDAEGPALRALGDAARACGYHVAVRACGRAPYLRLAADLDEHERSLSGNLRHDVQRRLRRLCEAGAVSVQVADGRERLDELLEEGFRVERLSWKGTQGTAIASAARTRHFYTALARWAASLDWLRLAFLRLDGRAIAFQFDLDVGAAYYSLKIGYDPQYERFAPGKLLAYTMVARAVVRGLPVYELLGTDEPWKYRWTEDGHDRVTLRAFSPSPAGRIGSAAFVYGRPLARRIPLAGRIASALRS
jgi:CelD/BcsL family acetyltransferase involved in cellulose biosynthesis